MGVTEQTARALVTALELLRGQLLGLGSPEVLTNASRSADGPPPAWAADLARQLRPDQPVSLPAMVIDPESGKFDPFPQKKPAVAPAQQPEPAAARPASEPLVERLTRAILGTPEHDSETGEGFGRVGGLFGREGVFAQAARAAFGTAVHDAKTGEYLGREGGLFGGRRGKYEKEGGKKDDDFGGAVANALARKFALVLGPLVAFQTLLSQSSSGFSTFTKAVSVFGATLAPLLLPVFAVLSAAVVAVSDVIWKELQPKLSEWYDWVLKSAIPATRRLVEAFQDVVKWAAELAGTAAQHFDKGDMTENMATRTVDAISGFFGLATLGGSKAGSAELAKPIPGMGTAARPVAEGMAGQAGLGDTVAGYVPGFFEGLAAAAVRRLSDQGAAGEGPPRRGPAGGADVFTGALKDVARSLQMSVGPKASYSALAEYGRQGQLAALNTDPIDAKAQQRSIQSIEAMVAAIERNTGRQPPNFPPPR